MRIPRFFRNVLIGIPIGIAFCDTVGYVARVEGISMQPALNPDLRYPDYVFLNRWTIRNQDIQRGDIVCVVSPKVPNQTLIKRVVGLAGDIIGTHGYKLCTIQVPEGHCWLEGDHVGRSMDSNTFGPISLGLVTAKATHIVWPPNRWQQHGLTIGDVDNDSDNELVVGTAEGELYIFKGSELWQKITGLGLITSVAIGDIFNYGRNALVVICGDGWTHIFYNTGNSQNTEHADNTNEVNELSGKMECVHVQRIPTNTKIVLIADVDKDGANEMILGLTDRVVRSYRWSSNADLETGKLVGLNKWECTNQIGTVTLQHTADGTPTLLVAQPGGTFMRIKCNPEDCQSKKSSCEAVDYQTLGISRMRNQNISTEIIGDLEPGITPFISTIESKISSYVPKDNENAPKGKPYALATLDGTIMAMQVDHQIFALCRLDVTGDNSDEIIACAWDGQTYILDQQRHSVRFQFEEPVRAFCTGNYNVIPGTPSPSLICLYYDVTLPSMTITPLNPVKDFESDETQVLEKLLGECNINEKQQKMQQLTEWLLYGVH
ncbi:Integrin-alpha FG-GAP repeat-containing protein 2 [Trachymyrmex zeteki]|uniref:Mitochondrial inner membrane protease subunit 2 n=1 Tax=Mycetomoellerius zeteki TaxID=64791 RepID=A0A151XED9_9HYME|nr:Integrin-alpha FG-GAP repeat-containing protein 2 [Trachymyrmex zeteki]